MDASKGKLLAKAKALFKLTIGLAGEANDNISGNGCLRHQRPNQRYCLMIITGRIASLHSIEHFITATLQGQVEMAAQTVVVP